MYVVVCCMLHFNLSEVKGIDSTCATVRKRAHSTERGTLMTDERMIEIVNAMTDEELVRELRFIDAVENIPQFPELVLIDYVNDLSLAVKDRVAERFIELVSK